jgi:hypothetical protein
MTNREETIRVLQQEVTTLASRLKPSGTEYITNEIRAKTKLNLDTLAAIDVINGRIAELKLEATEEMTVSEQMQEELEPIPTNTFDCGPIDRTAVTQSEMEKFYNDGPHIGARENDDGTWDMSAAARMETKPNRVRDAYLHSSKQKDDVKHTEEYYDTERNRPVESLL